MVQQTKYPDYPFLDTSRLDTVASYLSARNLLRESERVLRLETIGAPSRNSLARVVTAERAFVLKQFTEWPANGTSAPAAEDRFKAECQFHRSSRIAECPKSPVPALLHYDARARCLLMEDAGAGAGGHFSPTADDAQSLGWILVNLHHHTQSVPACARYENWAVRQWLSSHLFVGDTGTSRPAPWLERLMRASASVRETLKDARRALAEGGTCLIHGDFLPRNWMKNAGRCQVVDAEFSFFGRPEFDAGSFLAGLMFRRASAETLQAALAVLESGCVRYDPRFVAAFAGAHLVRLLDSAPKGTGAPSGPTASALLRRVARAMQTQSLAALR
ncbi:MAG: phosphotransferase [Opitutaceae bacterium]